MHLAIPFTLLMGYFVAAAPSIQHAQISVEITNMDAQDQVDALHSSEELVMNYADQDHPDDPDWDPENLPFNFTLGVQYVDGSQYGGQYEDLSFGFEDLQADPSVWGKIGFRTEFAFRNGALINGNKALGSHPTHVNPGWTSLWPLKKENEHKIFFLLAWSKNLRGKRHYSLEFSTSDFGWGALAIKRGEPVLWGQWDADTTIAKEIDSRNNILLVVQPVSDGINEDSAEELL